MFVDHSKQIAYCPQNTTTIFYLYYGRKRPKHVAIPKLKRNQICVRHTVNYNGAVKSLAQPGRHQATAAEDFDVCISYLVL